MEKDLKKIAVDGTPFFRKIDGVGRYSITLLARLADALPEHEFIVLGFSDDMFKDNTVPVRSNIRRHYLPIPRKLYQATFSHITPLAVDRLIPYSFSWHICLNFTCFPYLKQPKKVLVVHDLAYIDMPDTIEKRNLSYLRSRVKWSLEKSSKIVAISAFTKSRIEATFPQVKATALIIYPNIDPRFTVSDHSRSSSDIHNRYNLPARYMLTVGTREPRKNLQTLIKAYTSLPLGIKKECPLLLIGAKGWGADELRSDKYITSLGYLEDKDLPLIYKHAQLFIFPSLYEGFGLPVLEALSAGTRVISADIPSVREFAAHDVVFFEPNSAEDLTKKIRMTLAIKTGKKRRPTARLPVDDFKRLVEVISNEL